MTICDVALGPVIVEDSVLSACNGSTGHDSATFPLTITGTLGRDSDGVLVSDSDVDLVLSNLTLVAPFVCSASSVRITLDGPTTIHSPSALLSGIECANQSRLTFSGPGDASLFVTGGVNSSGIGAGPHSHCASLTFLGGRITARGGDNGAGIGSGSQNSRVDNVTIVAGDIIAASSGSFSGAGIGSGSGDSSVGSIRVLGGSLIAGGSAGIGSGQGIGGTSFVGEVIVGTASVTVAGTSGIGSGFARGGTSAVDSVRIEGGTIVTSRQFPPRRFELFWTAATGFGSGFSSGPSSLSRVGEIVIVSADVNATSANMGAGVGSGYAFDSGVSTVGRVTIVRSKLRSAAIGVGQSSRGSSDTGVVLILSSEVVASGIAGSAVYLNGSIGLESGNIAGSIVLGHAAIRATATATRLFGSAPTIVGPVDLTILYATRVTEPTELVGDIPAIEIGSLVLPGSLDYELRFGLKGASTGKSLVLNSSRVHRVFVSVAGAGDYVAVVDGIGTLDQEFHVGSTRLFVQEATLKLTVPTATPRPPAAPLAISPGTGSANFDIGWNGTHFLQTSVSGYGTFLKTSSFAVGGKPATLGVLTVATSWASLSATTILVAFRLSNDNPVQAECDIAVFCSAAADGPIVAADQGLSWSLGGNTVFVVGRASSLVENISAYWFGSRTELAGNYWSQTAENSFAGSDPAVAFSWQGVSVPAGGRKSVSAIFRSGLPEGARPTLAVNWTAFESNRVAIGFAGNGSGIFMVVDGDVARIALVAESVTEVTIRYGAYSIAAGNHSLDFYAVSQGGLVSAPVTVRVTVPPEGTPRPATGKMGVGAISGIVVGSVAGITAIVVAIVLMHRTKNQNRLLEEQTHLKLMQEYLVV
jgi:hypothetical protein